MIEAARALHSLITAKRLPAPRVTIHFMWVPEFFGTMAWVVNHTEARRCGNAWDDPRPRKADAKGCIIANLNLDMVGEDTVKTNSRFYLTRTPDSVPSFLDALMTDVLQQTREANLYAPTGTRNYWPTEVIPYTQGSDHDIFIGLGVPATMLGHDPDWTHHSSEDKLDKTDASEFRRVGMLASAAAWWLSHAGDKEWNQIHPLNLATQIGMRTRRIGTALVFLDQTAAKRVVGATEEKLTEAQQLLDNYKEDLFKTGRTTISIPEPSEVKGPRRNVFLPFYDTEFENLAGEDKKWWEEQTARFSDDSEGLATKPTLDLLMFEAVNFMNGRRTTGDIADLLSAEFLIDIDQAWVERLVGILERQKLVSTN
jgi:hypothetical protein